MLSADVHKEMCHSSTVCTFHNITSFLLCSRSESRLLCHNLVAWNFNIIFLTYETAIFSGAGKFWNSSHATLKMTSELLISEVTSLLHRHEKHGTTFRKGRYAT